MDADFFSCVSRGWRVPSPRSDITGRHCVFGEMRDRRFLSDELLGAEPDRCTEPPFALGTSALEFWNFDKSGLGGRWVVGHETFGMRHSSLTALAICLFTSGCIPVH